MRKLLVPFLLFTACTDPNASDSGDAGADAGPRRLCPVDDHNRPEKAVPIEVGTRYQDETYVCPQTDEDWFSFTLPAAQPLVTIEIAYPQGSATRVELSYALFEASNTTSPVATARDEVTTDNRSTVKSRHFVGLAGGSYFLVVRDDGNDEQDTLNSYGVTITTAADMDPNEPNETCATAKPLTGSLTGAISFTGDRDAYSFTIPSGSKIVDAHLTTTKVTPVDLRVSLFKIGDDQLIDFEEDRMGESGATNVLLRNGVVSDGSTYCLLVEDDDAKDADVDTVYSLTLQLIDEVDPSEQTLRNDLPRDATDLAGGRQVTGDLNSKGDLDWFRVRANIGQVIEISLDCPSCTGIQPTISLVHADPDGPNCQQGLNCDYLLSARSCTSPSDCGSGICEGTDVRYCARECDRRLDCPGLQCQTSETSANISACAGAATCLPGATRQCGVLQYTATAPMNMTSVRTAQPAIRGQTFILVRDFQDDAFSPGTYTLNVRVVDDPDANEPNNFYAPYTDVRTEEVLDRGRDRATVIPWTRRGSVMEASGRGCIGYQGDVDLFRIQGGNPCTLLTSTTTPSRTGVNCGIQIIYDRPGGPNELTYFLYNRGFGGVSSFRASDEGGETVFGDTTCRMSTDEECSFFYATDDPQEDYYFTVRDFGQDAWDTDAARCYNFTLRSAPSAGCPAACPNVAPNNLCRCDP